MFSEHFTNSSENQRYSSGSLKSYSQTVIINSNNLEVGALYANSK